MQITCSLALTFKGSYFKDVGFFNLVFLFFFVVVYFMVIDSCLSALKPC